MGLPYRSFYKAAGKVMQIAVFKDTLTADYDSIETLVLPATAKRISALKQTYMQKYLRCYVKRKQHRYFKQHQEKEANVSPPL
jgi:hypothetical protein